MSIFKAIRLWGLAHASHLGEPHLHLFCQIKHGAGQVQPQSWVLIIWKPNSLIPLSMPSPSWLSPHQSTGRSFQRLLSQTTSNQVFHTSHLFPSAMEARSWVWRLGRPEPHSPRLCGGPWMIDSYHNSLPVVSLHKFCLSSPSLALALKALLSACDKESHQRI